MDQLHNTLERLDAKLMLLEARKRERAANYQRVHEFSGNPLSNGSNIEDNTYSVYNQILDMEHAPQNGINWKLKVGNLIYRNHERGFISLHLLENLFNGVEIMRILNKQDVLRAIQDIKEGNVESYKTNQ